MTHRRVAPLTRVADYPALQRLGSAWYVAQETLVLKVPSAVIPYEYNYLNNTEHPDFDQHVQPVHTEDYFWDDRLL
ncbi:RES family NAD+ phosphorylase [Fibrella forsythiae]|uniref:RES family NAD+ phosphorylase n=1 Tax=Fibrella forsythiae TaxID=2817061 RepID=A0ABS3JRA1_9BACT|nr:RES family NAD+ phosphorylase [Fibrella forsythiae]MBO0952526.1 RES family NAD+ phosphorylase [Fibrella forsythiae]